MRPGPATTRLVEDLADRRARGLPAPIVFLGAACSRAAHTPRVAEIAREIVGQLREDEELVTPALPAPDAPDAELVPAFRRLVLSLPPIQRRALALHASAGVPVPQFFQDMALLVRDGLFTTVMSSAFDALVGRALTLQGAATGESLRVVDLGDEPQSPLVEPGRVTLVKVHGARVPCPLEPPVVVVGHEADDPDLFEALAVRGEPVWWVGEQPPPAALDAVRGARPVEVIGGPGAHPDRFFGELAVLAVQMPAVNVLVDPDGARRKAAALPGGAPSVSTALAAIGGTAPPADEQEFERQFLEGRRRRCEELLSRLQLIGAGGAQDPTLDRQLAYQRDELALLEQELRALATNRNDLLDVLARIEASPEARDGAAGEYLRATVDRIRSEYDGDAPDEVVVSGALAAVTVLGARLKVPAPLLQRLEAHMPSVQVAVT